MLSNIKAYFKLSKWESIAMLVLCGFMLLLVGINYSLPFIFNKKNNASAADSIALQQLAAQIQADTNTSNWQQYKTYTPSDGSNIHGFAFNPNELDDAGWKKLGFSDKAVNTILNYKNKGGKFYCKADVHKMYSISEAEYTKLEPFIQLPATKQFAKNRYSNNHTTKEKITVEIEKLDNEIFDRSLYNFLNIDTQGYELEVLKGAENTLKHIIGIIIEVNFVEMYENNGIFYEIREFLEKHNFVQEKIALVDDQTWGEAYFKKI
jgi:hypothetical protein